MVIFNNNGIIVIEALKMLSKPAPLKTIVTTVASLLDCAENDVLEFVRITLEGGVQHGFILNRNNRYAFKLMHLDLAERKNSFTEIKKFHDCKIKAIKCPDKIEEKVEILHNRKDNSVVKTLFKSSKRMSNSGELSLKSSAPCCVPKKNFSPTVKASVKSLPARTKVAVLKSVKK